jgi:hypothetical protein
MPTRHARPTVDHMLPLSMAARTIGDNGGLLPKAPRRSGRRRHRRAARFLVVSAALVLVLVAGGLAAVHVV